MVCQIWQLLPLVARRRCPALGPALVGRAGTAAIARSTATLVVVYDLQQSTRAIALVEVDHVSFEQTSPPISQWPWMPERALIVDGDPIWLEALRRWLSAYGLRSIATATNMASANGALAGDEDVVITEVTVARETCFGLVARALGRRASPVIVAMSDRASRAHVFRLKDFGVHAYLEKPFDSATLYRCLEQLASRPHDSSCDALDVPARASARGASAVSASVEAVVAAHRARYNLTNAEAEILRCILRGMCRVDVARERGISINTVKTQVRSLLWKSGATNVKELVRLAARDLRPRA